MIAMHACDQAVFAGRIGVKSATLGDRAANPGPLEWVHAGLALHREVVAADAWDQQGEQRPIVDH
jgi:hypothetical protein